MCYPINDNYERIQKKSQDILQLFIHVFFSSCYCVSLFSSGCCSYVYLNCLTCRWKIFSLVWTLNTDLNKEGSLSCHVSCDAFLRFLQFHLTDHPHPLVICIGRGLIRVYAITTTNSIYSLHVSRQVLSLSLSISLSLSLSLYSNISFSSIAKKFYPKKECLKTNNTVHSFHFTYMYM
jgi:hypothetical protein